MRAMTDRPATEPRTETSQRILTGLRGPDFGSTVDEILIDGIRRRLIEAEAEAAQGAAPLDVNALRHYLWEAAHEEKHRGDGYYEACMECMASADATIADLSEGAAPRADEWESFTASDGHKGLRLAAPRAEGLDESELVDIIEQAIFETDTGLEAAMLAAERILSRPSDEKEES